MLTDTGDVCISSIPIDTYHCLYAPVAVAYITADLIVAVYVLGDEPGDLVVRGCLPRGMWVDLGTVDGPLPCCTFHRESRPTITVCKLPSSGVSARSETSVVIAHSLCNEDGEGGGSVIDGMAGWWWAASLAVVRDAVMRDGAAAPEWRVATRAVGTPVREGAACVRLPQY